MGSVLLTTAQPTNPCHRRNSLPYVEGHLISLSEDGTLRLLRATPERDDVVTELVVRYATGEPLLDDPAWSAPVLSHGLL